MAQIKAAFLILTARCFRSTPRPCRNPPCRRWPHCEKRRKTFIATGRPPVHLPYLHALDGIPFDSYVTMLEYAGIGVAMGNACDAAKAAADYVTDDITADGLAKALAHFGLI